MLRAQADVCLDKNHTGVRTPVSSGAVELPAPTTCLAAKCGADVLLLPTWSRSVLAVDPRPDSRGTVHVHGDHGRTIAQTLGPDAAKGFRKAELPLYRKHETTCVAKAGKP